MDSRIGGESSPIRRLLQERTEAQRKSFARLASGRRIAEAADDPAGLGISERMRSQLRSLSQALRNTHSGIDVGRTAESGLRRIGDDLSRMRELAVRSANGTLSPEDRTALDTEFQALKDQIDDVAQQTKLGDVAPLDGSAGTSIQVGTDGGETLPVPSVDATAAGLALDGLEVVDPASSENAIAEIDRAIERVASAEGSFGAFIHNLDSVQRSTMQERDSLAVAESQISSLDVALESARLVGERLLANAGVSSLVQANVAASQAMGLL